MKRILFVAFLIVSIRCFAQSYTVSGYIIDKKTGETLIGVNVQVKGELRGAASDGNGFFRITGLVPGQITLMFTHIGYSKREYDLTIIDRSLILDDIALEPQTIELEGVVVTATRFEIADTDVESGHREITPEAIRRIPTSRSDVFRALRYLPGIQGIDPISPLISVRGGDPGENLILLDGVTIYNPYHCVASSGLFNLYAIKDIEMLVGGFGAEYGGRNSSVLYITTREGNNQELHGEIEPGLSHSKMVFDFPVGRNATMMVSARAYYDLVSRFMFDSPNLFYDMNVAFNWKLNSKNRLSLRYFYSRDLMDLDFGMFYSYIDPTFDIDIFDDYDLIYRNRWENQAATAILKTVINPWIYLKTQISGSFFSSKNFSLLDFEYTDEDEGDTQKLYHHTDIKNRIQDLTGKLTLNLVPSRTLSLTVGGEYSRYLFSNDIRVNELGEGQTSRKPTLLAGFIENKLTWGPLLFRLGLRLSKFRDARRWYHEPRVQGVLHLPYDLKLKAAWGRYYQYIVSINSAEFELSQLLDYYYPIRGREPSTSIHHILGLERRVTDHTKVAFDLYYKDISVAYTYDYNISEMDAYRFSDKLIQGTGKAYGLEILWMGTWQRFSGWMSCGISRATRRYPHIMDGEEFLYDYDRLFTFKAMVSHQIHPALSYSGTLRIMTGVPKTIEATAKSYFYYNPTANEYANSTTFYNERKNNARLPWSIRLDLGLKKRLRRGFGADLAEFLGADESYLVFSIANLLFLRRDVMYYFPVFEEKLYGFGWNYIPWISIGYTIKL